MVTHPATDPIRLGLTWSLVVKGNALTVYATRAPNETTPNPITSIECDGVISTIPQDIASSLNSFFVSIGKKLSGLIVSSEFVAAEWLSSTTSCFNFNEISQTFVRDQLQNLRVNKAIGSII